ncbi:HAD family hydrolase [Actinokineospora inagensis]|uniref:HAD family hydrolase n=1 Tax=Actinokineospora inagensis TaxID=103730 RepID=UPI00054DE628|nr:HAD family hydrolase [Actinokineospora inagensis]
MSEVLASASAVIFDFDGPLCDVFAGHPAGVVARSLEKLLGVPVQSDDPLEVLRESREHDSDKLREVERALIAAELHAVACSDVTPGGLEAVRACIASSRKVAVVSNNSEDAVSAFLRNVGLSDVVRPVVGRYPARPDLMKPNTWPMVCALEALGVQAGKAVFVGDSITDLEVAAAVGTPCLAYANKPGKREAFEAAGAAVVFTDMHQMADALR